jgi:nitrogen-specific signal transduction histidine kinase/ActR/RegA family two-component response regulator
LVGAVLVFRDISESRAVERELQKVKNLESLGLLAGGIAHDFNNILTGILANASLAKAMTKGNAELQEVLGDSETACRRARDLTRQLLTFSRGGAPIRKTASATALIREAASFALRGSEATCEIVPVEGLWPVKVDEGQMNQVLSNLLINADQAMPDGGTISVGTENVTVDDGAAGPLKPGDYVKVTIRDRGVGIPPEDLPRVFDPYFSTKQNGSGLGLATSYSIVKKHEGYISVESKESEGSTFMVYLPAVRHAAEPTSPSKTDITGGGDRILLMDDEEIVRKAAGLLLRELGYEITCVADGQAAVECYEKALKSECPFDAVVLDLTVPGGMGGQQAVEELRNLDPHVKAIVSSGYSNNPVMADAAAYGFDAVVRKPYDMEELAGALSRVVGASHADLESDSAREEER